MNTKKFAQAVLLSMLLVSALLLGGCSQPEIGDHDIMEEPEITVDYLSGEYAQQLLRDGGEEILGTIEKLYDVYIIGDHALMLLARELPGA